MKKFLILTLILMLSVSVLQSQEDNLVEELKSSINELPVGTIIASMLEPNLFFEVYSRHHWAPADGNEAPNGSHYYKIQSRYKATTKLPDLRGKFLRGLNNLGTSSVSPSKGDIATDRKVGSYQRDTTKLPNRNFIVSSNGNHSHTMGRNGADTFSMAPGGASQRLAHFSTDSYGGGLKKSTDQNGAHTHTIRGGDPETRPKNVAVYFYVKINLYGKRK